MSIEATYVIAVMQGLQNLVITLNENPIGAFALLCILIMVVFGIALVAVPFRRQDRIG